MKMFEVYGWAMVPQDYAMVMADDENEAIKKFAAFLKNKPEEAEVSKPVADWFVLPAVFEDDVRIVRGD
jgi:ABC-type glycerol-3-phosphate transport system substrate-binding protein